MTGPKQKIYLDGMYDLLSQAYKANWQHRCEGTPYMSKASLDNKLEPVSGHVWGCLEAWYLLRRICPSLDKLVNPTEIYEILLNHDLGEARRGDVSLYKIINGEDRAKDLEREEIREMSGPLGPIGIQKELLDWFDDFEQDIGEITKLETLVAKFLDHLQGDHFVMVYGNDLSDHSESIGKILKIRFIAYAKRLLQVLKGEGHQSAFNEIKIVTQHHLRMIKATGINADFSRTGRDLSST